MSERFDKLRTGLCQHTETSDGGHKIRCWQEATHVAMVEGATVSLGGTPVVVPFDVGSITPHLRCQDHLASFCTGAAGSQWRVTSTGRKNKSSAADALTAAGVPKSMDRLQECVASDELRIEVLARQRNQLEATVKWLDADVLRACHELVRDHGVTFEDVWRWLWGRVDSAYRDGRKDTDPPDRAVIQPVLDNPFVPWGERPQMRWKRGDAPKCTAWTGPCACGYFHVNGEGT